MTHSQIEALEADRFAHLFGATDEALAQAGVVARIADAKPGFPCRVMLTDAEPGQRMLLLNHVHQPAETPYRSSHAIFVIDGAQTARPKPGEIPDVMGRRLLSVRAFSHDDMILDADVVEGRAAAPLFERMLANSSVAYLHAHYAKFGCYAARVVRA